MNTLQLDQDRIFNGDVYEMKKYFALKTNHHASILNCFRSVIVWHCECFVLDFGKNKIRIWASKASSEGHGELGICKGVGTTLWWRIAARG